MQPRQDSGGINPRPMRAYFNPLIHQQHRNYVNLCPDEQHSLHPLVQGSQELRQVVYSFESPALRYEAIPVRHSPAPAVAPPTILPSL